MLHFTRLCFFLLLSLLPALVARADLIDNVDLTTIDDPGNPSHGLSFLDMSFSLNRTAVDAVAFANLTHPGARLATPAEVDDLLMATGPLVWNMVAPSTAWSVGATTYSTEPATDGDLLALMNLLGPTVFGDLYLVTANSAPDGDDDPTTTRDILQFFVLNLAGAESSQIISGQNTDVPPQPFVGWFLVLDAQQVPEPTSVMLWILLGMMGTGWMRFRKRGSRK